MSPGAPWGPSLCGVTAGTCTAALPCDFGSITGAANPPQPRRDPSAELCAGAPGAQTPGPRRGDKAAAHCTVCYSVGRLICSPPPARLAAPAQRCQRPPMWGPDQAQDGASAGFWHRSSALALRRFHPPAPGCMPVRNGQLVVGRARRRRNHFISCSRRFPWFPDTLPALSFLLGLFCVQNYPVPCFPPFGVAFPQGRCRERLMLGGCDGESSRPCFL